jgi:hypothetical protein
MLVASGQRAVDRDQVPTSVAGAALTPSIDQVAMRQKLELLAGSELIFGDVER